MPPEAAPQATPEAPTPDAAPDAGLNLERGFVGNSVSGRAARIEAALAAAKAEVGEVSDEQHAAEMAGQVEPKTKATETEEEPAPAAKPASKGKKKEEQPEPEPPAAADPADVLPGGYSLAHERRKLRTSFEQRESQRVAHYQSQHAALQQREAALAPLLEAAEAAQMGDLDGIAAGLSKFKGGDAKTWNDFQSEALNGTNPLHREIRALKAQQRAAAEAAQRQQAQAQQQQRAAQEQQAHQQWLSGIADDLSADDDASVRELMDVEPQFAGYVYQEQRRNHAEHGEILPAREGAERALANIWAKVAAWHAFAQKHAASPLIQKITGLKPAPAKSAKGTASPNGESGTADRNGVRKPAAKAPPAVSQNRTAEASAVGRQSQAEIKRLWADRMNAAASREAMGDAPE